MGKHTAVAATIKFEDQGQDFLEWDIDRLGYVIKSRPFQSWVWSAHIVDLRSIIVGKPLQVHTQIYGMRKLKYKTKHVEYFDDKIIKPDDDDLNYEEE